MTYYSHICIKNCCATTIDKANAQDVYDLPFKNFLMPVGCIHFGYHFNELSSTCLPDHLIYIKKRCKDCLVKLTEELQAQARVPKNTKCLQKICVFAPKVVNQVNIKKTFLNWLSLTVQFVATLLTSS